MSSEPHNAVGHPRRCTAKSSRTGERCRAWAIRGATVCGAHGGRSPQVKAAAARRQAQERAERQAGALGLQEGTPVADPVDALMGMAGKAVALVDALERQVAALEKIGTVPGGRWGDQIAPELQAYIGALREGERLLSTLARLNLSERLVRLDEQRAAIVVRVIEAVLTQNGIDPRRLDVRQAVAHQLELVAAS